MVVVVVVASEVVVDAEDLDEEAVAVALVDEAEDSEVDEVEDSAEVEEAEVSAEEDEVVVVVDEAAGDDVLNVMGLCSTEFQAAGSTVVRPGTHPTYA